MKRNSRLGQSPSSTTRPSTRLSTHFLASNTSDGLASRKMFRIILTKATLENPFFPVLFFVDDDADVVFFFFLFYTRPSSVLSAAVLIPPSLARAVFLSKRKDAKNKMKLQKNKYLNPAMHRRGTSESSETIGFSFGIRPSTYGVLFFLLIRGGLCKFDICFCRTYRQILGSL